MRWILEVAYIGTTTSWRWLLGSTAVAGALVGLLFGIGVIGGGGGDGDSNPPLASVSATTTPDADPVDHSGRLTNSHPGASSG